MGAEEISSSRLGLRLRLWDN